jgi:hypothetical protein
MLVQSSLEDLRYGFQVGFIGDLQASMATYNRRANNYAWFVVVFTFTTMGVICRSVEPSTDPFSDLSDISDILPSLFVYCTDIAVSLVAGAMVMWLKLHMWLSAQATAEHLITEVGALRGLCQTADVNMITVRSILHTTG